MDNIENSSKLTATPTESDVLKEAFDLFMSHVHTGMPGQVTKYNQANQTVNVAPCLMRRNYDNPNPLPLPEIKNVPVGFQQMGGAFVRLPIVVGNHGWLHFSERSIDQWQQQGGVVDPQDSRKYDFTDACFYPGVKPATEAMNIKAPLTSMEINLNGAYIEITAAGQFRITSGGVELLATLANLISTLEAIVIPSTPFSFSTVSGLATALANINTLKAP